VSICPVRPCGEGDRALLTALLAAYPYNDLRRYRIINREKQIAHLEYRIAACAREGGVWVSESGGALRALAAFRPLPWDSSIFGIQMGQMPLFIHEGMVEGTRQAIEDLLDVVLRSCKDRGVAHLNIRVDTDDLALVQLLEARGFYLVDTIVAYIFIPARQELGHFKYLFKTRVYREEDHGAVLQVAREAYRNFYGRYHADPHLPRERCDHLYQVWAEKIIEPGFAEQIIVAERRGRVVGFLGYRMKKDIMESTGIKVVGGGLGGCLPEGFGAYAAILEEAMREGMHRYDMQDFETQLNNINIVRIYQKLNFEYARGKYTFHAWLGKT
jgi:hypothetical protein